MTQALQVVILVLVALGATLVVMMRGRVRQMVALSAYGVALAVLFFAVPAPGVTLSGLVVGAVAPASAVPRPIARWEVACQGRAKRAGGGAVRLDQSGRGGRSW
jgi:uncharacterized MnhB-related membrane protein